MHLFVKFQAVAPEDKYEVLRDITNSGLVVASTEEPKIEVVVTLTSVLLRGPPPGGKRYLWHCIWLCEWVKG